jgi:uncharacterized phage protein gp47/JayE
MAAFENKTVGEIRDFIINSIQTKFNIAFRMLSKSFIRVLAVVFAGVFVVLYKLRGWLFLQLYPETAYWGDTYILGVKVNPLVNWGNLIGVGEPKAGTQWKGIVTINVTAQGGALTAGTQLASDITGKIYITEDSAALDAENISVSVICAETGMAGNLDAGDILSFVNPLGNVKKTAAVAAVMEYAADDETGEEYRARVTARFKNSPLGGALSDYRKWALDAAGVLNVYPYKDVNSASGVIIYVAASPAFFPNRIPSTELLRKVGDACTYDPETGKSSRKPVTAVIDPDADGTYRNIKPVTIIYFDVNISGMAGVPFDDFAEAIYSALENYFLSREPYIRGLSDDNNKTNIVSKNNVSSVVDSASASVKAEFGSVSVLVNGIITAGYSLGAGELAALNNLYINGALYAR